MIAAMVGTMIASVKAATNAAHRAPRSLRVPCRAMPDERARASARKSISPPDNQSLGKDREYLPRRATSAVLTGFNTEHSIMRTTSVRALQALLILAPATVAFTSAYNSLDLETGSRLWVSGTSTVRAWQCKAAGFEASIATSAPTGAPAAILAGDKAVTTVSVSVPTERLDCSNGTMNEHMLKALKAKEFPTIVFTLATYDLAKQDGGVKVTMNGTLTLGGVEKAITMQADAREESAGVLRVTGAHELRMKEYGLKPPTLMLGTMKVNELVKVNFDLLLKD